MFSSSFSWRRRPEKLGVLEELSNLSTASISSSSHGEEVEAEVIVGVKVLVEERFLAEVIEAVSTVGDLMSEESETETDFEPPQPQLREKMELEVLLFFLTMVTALVSSPS